MGRPGNAAKGWPPARWSPGWAEVSLRFKHSELSPNQAPPPEKYRKMDAHGWGKHINALTEEWEDDLGDRFPCSTEELGGPEESKALVGEYAAIAPA